MIGEPGRAVRFCAAAFVVAALLSPRTAAAAPAFSAGWDTGVCGGDAQVGLSKPGWCNALRGDVLFLRERSRDFGVGPALRLGTARFDDLRLDAGVAALFPLFESFPLVLEAGPHLRNFHEPGIYGSAFFGLRSFTITAPTRPPPALPSPPSAPSSAERLQRCGSPRASTAPGCSCPESFFTMR